MEEEFLNEILGDIILDDVDWSEQNWPEDFTDVQ